MTTGAGEGGTVGSDVLSFDDDIISDSILGDLIDDEEITVGANRKPQTFFIPSREYGITPNEAADMLLVAREIRSNKKLLRAAIIILLAKKRAIEVVL